MTATKARRARRNKGKEPISRDVLQEKQLTLKARGIIALLVSLPDEWDCNGVDGIVKQFCAKDGAYAVNEGIKELEAAGLFVRLKRQGDGGVWEWLWSYSDDPDDVAAAVGEWEAAGYKTAARRGNRNATPPPRPAKTTPDPMLGKLQHGPVLGKPVDGEPVDGWPVHGEPPNKESHSHLPTGDGSSERYSEREPPLRFGSATGPPAPGVDEVWPADAPAEDEPSPLDVDVAIATRQARRRRNTPTALNSSAHTVGARRLVEAYATTCAMRPPNEVFIGLAVQVDSLLTQGVPEAVISTGLTEWGQKGFHHNALPSFVHAVANRKPAAPRPSRTRENFDHMQGIAARLAEQERVPAFAGGLFDRPAAIEGNVIDGQVVGR